MVIMQDILYVIFNYSYMWCSEPFIYLILSPKEIGVWMLEVWPVNNKNLCEQLCFRGRHTVKVVNFGQLLQFLSPPWDGGEPFK